MTTANLSIGINTAAAKQGLAEFRRELASAVMNVMVAVDPLSFDKQIQKYLGQKTFRFKVDLADLRSVAVELDAEVTSGLRRAFAKERDLNWNSNKFFSTISAAVNNVFYQNKRVLQFDNVGLSTSVKRALDEAFAIPRTIRVDTSGISGQLKTATAGMSVGTGHTGPGAPISPSTELLTTVATSIRSALAPATEELAKAASTIAGTARKVRAAPQEGESPAVRYSRSLSTKGPDGSTLRRAEGVTPDAGASDLAGGLMLPNRGTMDAAIAQQRADADTFERERARIDQQSSNRVLATRIRLRKQEAVAERAAAAFGPNRETLDASLASARSEAETFERERQKIAQQSSNRVLATRARLRKQEDAAERAAAAFGPNRATLDASLASARSDADAFERERAKIDQQSSNRVLATRIRLRKQEAAAERAAAAFGPNRETLDASLASARSEAESFERERQKIAQQSSNRVLATRARLRKQEEAAERAAAAFGPDRSVLDRSLAQSRADTSNDVKQGMKFDAPGQESALKRLEAQIKRLKEAQYLIENGQFAAAISQYGKRAVEQIPQIAALTRELDRLRLANEAAGRSSGETAAAALKRRMGSQYEQAKYDAAKSYSGPGVKIAAAQSLAEQEGPERARAFLGNQGFLLDQGKDLDRYRTKVRAAADSHNSLAAAMRDGHSAARGLAGSMGQMWLTWGATAPLLAGAAIGASIRTVFTAGKDLEYQLKFVSILSEGAAVDIGRFFSVVRGGAVAPVAAAEALRGLAQNGLNARESLIALPSILNLATAGEMGLMEAALGATGVMAAFNLQVTDLGRVGDVFAKAAASSNTSVASMVESMKQASTVSDQYKVSLEETAASLAVLAKRNITGTAAGTAFRNMVSELAAPSKKAKDAMKELGLELYDGNNQLKKFPEVLEQLESAVSGLNEKGRLAFLGDLFDERGAKAASALLSDMGLLKSTLKDLKENSDGFSRSIVAALGETTQGKIKRLISEFQVSAIQAFNQVSVSVQGFVDKLREFVGSESFKNAVQSLIKGVVELSQYLFENGMSVVKLIGAWYALKAAFAITATITEVIGALKLLEIGLISTARAGVMMWSALAGPVALIAALGIQYLSLRKNIDDVEVALRAKANTLRNQNVEAEAHLGTLRAENNLLAEQVALILAGNTARGAESTSKRNQALAKVQADKAMGLGAEKAATDRLAQIQSDADAVRRKYGNKTGGAVDTEETRTLKARVLEARRIQSEAVQQEKLIIETGAQEGLKAYQSGYTKALGALQDYNEKAKKINAKGGVQLEIVDLNSVKRRDPGQLNEMLEELEAEKNRKLRGYESKDKKHGKSDAEKQESSELRNLELQLDQQEQAMKRALAFQKEMDDARSQGDKYGPYIAAAMAERRETEANTESLEFQAEALQKLAALRVKMASLGRPQWDIDNVDRAISKRIDSYGVTRERAGQQTDVAGAKSDTSNARADEEFKSLMARMRSASALAQTELTQKYNLKVTDPVSGASQVASAKVLKQYEDERVKLQGQINSQIKLSEDLQGSVLDVAKDQIANDQERLRLLTEQANLEAEMAGSIAAKLEDQSRTAQNGYQKFWAEYVSLGQSSAEAVYDTMKSSTDKMSEALAGFVSTGKLNFRSLAASIMADAAKMMANRAVKMMLNYVINAIGSYGSGGSAYSSGAANGGAVVEGFSRPGEGFANGGIMTSAGPLNLRAYSAGGIANSPQLALYGEGRTPEAYVPLPDGRSIPVTMQGSTGGNAVAYVTVNVMPGGETKVQSDASGGKASQLGRQIEGAVMAVIQREKRPGGILSE